VARRPFLVVFLRAPQRGAVKRRLAAGIGAAAAFQFYASQSRALIRRLGADRRWRLVLAATPDAPARRGRFWPATARNWSRLPQGTGDLGARMARVFERLPPGPAVIVGSDIPGIDAGLIAEAFARLARHEAVFGPAADGGYWLIGLARRKLAPRALARRLFRGVRWSGPHALADTRRNLPKGAEAPSLLTLEDVDDAASFRRWAARENPVVRRGRVW
jgi:rSAM/selenodomain-associated transferase 1